MSDESKKQGIHVQGIIDFYEGQGLPGVVELAHWLATEGRWVKKIGSSEYRIHEAIAECQDEEAQRLVSMLYSNPLYFGKLDGSETPLESLKRMQISIPALESVHRNNLDAFCAELAQCAMGRQAEPKLVNTLSII